MSGGVLVSGFGPFGVNTRNPTGEVARALDGRCLWGVTLRGVELPVEWGTAFEALQAAVAASRPRALVMFGVADRAGVSIESTARNDRSARPDVRGQAGPAGPIEAEGPARLASTLPASLAASLGPLPCIPSDDAGDYLCNYVFYRALRSLPDVPLRGFVHVPRLWSPATPDGRSWSQIQASMTHLVAALARHVARSTA